MGITAAAGLLLAGGVAAAVLPRTGAPAQTDAAPPAAGGSTAAGTVAAGRFARAAREFQVPVPVLMAVAYAESRWDGHAGQLSADGGYGLMDLTRVTPAMLAAGTPGGAGGRSAAGPALHTLDAAAGLTGIAPALLRSRDLDNLRGGAALLAAAERRLTGGTPADPAAWYGAVARYSRSADPAVARRFADEVYGVLASGARRTTPAGRLVLAARPGLRPDRRTVPSARGAGDGDGPQCPAAVRCSVLPAASATYQRADRPLDGLRIRYIVIHDTEGGYASSLRSFRDPSGDAAAQYVMRASDGAVTQMVPDQDIAFHAGNYWFNLHSVGIEHEGFAASGATWYTEAQYRATADLVRYLSARYGVPLDREHVIGHDNVPGVTSSGVAGMHWDPGPYWDWTHFMALLGAPAADAGGGMPATGTAVTVAPPFDTDRQAVRVCGQPTGASGGGPDHADDADHDAPARGCREQREPSDFLYVRTAPSASAPLFGDPALHGHAGDGSDAIDDWGGTVSAGQRFVVAGRSGDWTAIWFSGAKVWFANPGGVNTAPAPGAVVVGPVTGTAPAPVYGQAFPAPSEYPAGLTPSDHRPLAQYAVPAGQAYVASVAPVPSDDYVAASGVVVTGRERYWTVQYGHRLALLDAADVVARSG
ncbi:N-acetylmuramoyl-L-alanine amidase [Streptomyces sp. SL13]|uniref:N-acetylmuramoyl-L-alanine amidase n=1 Tax=Streptantibioticus silvisoli TaxID=2705255 RepID=A0AA90JWD9_9ACTN|nr:N-acetylmuramoyl-L-alanine amidase [Streptantibioticus silvisoli]MDI5968981.1 N-acetylmuramoyl-L-alanine amidase [Streptantibioticus silvisoli]